MLVIKGFDGLHYSKDPSMFFSLGKEWSEELGDSQEEMSFGYQECVQDPEQIFVFPLMPSWSSH